MAKQLYGTIRRVLNTGIDGTPWSGEVALFSGEGIAYIEMERAPAAAAGDDILTFADLARERDGRLVARNAGLPDEGKTALRRLREGTRNSRIDAGWQVLSGIVSAEKQGDVRLVMDGQSLSVVRPTVSLQPARDIIARHSQKEGTGKFVLDPVVYASAARAAARKATTAKGTVLNFGDVDSCAYTQIAGMSGPGMIPTFDIPAALAHEFATARAFALQLDGPKGKAETLSPLERRQTDSFADAFAVTELILAGRSPKDIDRIVACREAAVIGLATGKAKGRSEEASVSGTAARAALNAAYAVVQKGGHVDPAALVQQAKRLSELHTISDKGMKDLKSALRSLGSNATAADISGWLKNLAKTTADKNLSQNASSLAKRLKGFYTPRDQKSREVGAKIGRLHADSLRKHLAYAKENGLSTRPDGLLAGKETSVWNIAPEGIMGRLARFVRAPADHGSVIRSNIDSIPAGHATAEVPALKLPTMESSDPNPWTFSVADRLKQAGGQAENAYKVIAEMAANGGIPTFAHEERFATAMRRLSSFVEALVLRDPLKDGKTVRKRLDANPELEDYLKLWAAGGFRNEKLQMDEGLRVQIKSLILAINPAADVPEMPAPPEVVSGVEFGQNMFVSSDRD